LPAKDAHIIIVGNAKDFLEPLRKQFANVEVIPLSELDLNSAALRKASAAARR
jgi:zinc protease